MDNLNFHTNLMVSYLLYKRFYSDIRKCPDLTIFFFLIILLSGDVKNPQPCIKITVDEAAARLIPDLIPTPSTISVLKIRLVKDSEFFHLLLEGLTHASVLHSTEQKRLSGKVDALETQLAKAVCNDFTYVR